MVEKKRKEATDERKIEKKGRFWLDSGEREKKRAEQAAEDRIGKKKKNRGERPRDNRGRFRQASKRRRNRGGIWKIGEAKVTATTEGEIERKDRGVLEETERARGVFGWATRK